jgi:hypothetical protein
MKMKTISNIGVAFATILFTIEVSLYGQGFTIPNQICLDAGSYNGCGVAYTVRDIYKAAAALFEQGVGFW